MPEGSPHRSDFAPRLDDRIHICQTCGQRLHYLSNFDYAYCPKHGFTTEAPINYIREDIVKETLRPVQSQSTSAWTPAEPRPSEE
jgi:hypothetical protein